MKIPNFLHLTPPVITKQCEALKKFCTPWPQEVSRNSVRQNHFPIQVITSDYVHGLPTIKNPLSRIVTVKFKLNKLKLDAHAKDKFIRLVGDRYDKKSGMLTIVTDRCPLKKQNYDYAMYLITALYHESNIFEEWEATKSEADMEYYDWNRNRSKVTSTEILNWPSKEQTIQPPETYARSVEALMKVGESPATLIHYKKEVLKMLGLQKDDPSETSSIPVQPSEPTQNA